MTEFGFQRPKLLECDYETLTSTYGRFTAQPFERGFGTTVGNALRRILLSSIKGAAVTAVRIQGVVHEFSTVPGVVEDVTDIILNLKSVPLKLKGTGPKVLTLRKEGPATATSADLTGDGDIEVLDKAVLIASLDKDGVLDAELIVENNRGFITADQNFDETRSLDTIPLDSSHSPVLRANYRVEPARVGKRIDYEKLTLEIWTTGAVPPVEALAQAAKVMRDHLIIFLNVVDERAENEPVTAKREVPYFAQVDLLAKPIEHLELSVRSNNCLRSAGIEKIYELVMKSEDELLKTKNFGRKSLGEIKDTLVTLGLGLSLDLNPKLLERIKGETKEKAKETDE